MKTLSDFRAINIKGEEIPLSLYAGQVVLIVNTASACGFTPQYEGLESLYQQYKEKGFTVLGFPCNQFGAQEPGTNEEIAQFCQTRFAVTFPMFAKIEVNGDQAHPLYQWLKSSQKGILGSEAIKWNFTKFLLNREGVVVKRYGSIDKPSSISDDIKKYL